MEEKTCELYLAEQAVTDPEISDRVCDGRGKNENARGIKKEKKKRKKGKDLEV